MSMRGRSPNTSWRRMLDPTVGYGALTRAIAENGWAAAYFSRPPHGELAGADRSG